MLKWQYDADGGLKCGCIIIDVFGDNLTGWAAEVVVRSKRNSLAQWQVLPTYHARTREAVITKAKRGANAFVKRVDAAPKVG